DRLHGDHAATPQGVHLVAHQRLEGADDDGRPRRENAVELEDRALAEPGRQDTDAGLPAQAALHELDLFRLQLAIGEVAPGEVVEERPLEADRARITRWSDPGFPHQRRRDAFELLEP